MCFSFIIHHFRNIFYTKNALKPGALLQHIDSWGKQSEHYPNNSRIIIS
nr:MAG TPA: hypothetical protein [Caudoviricetes sp.]